jgi:chromosome segregation ATPase
MPKSKASEAMEQELASMKLDMEGMNKRQEEIGGKVDTVQTMMTELTDKFSRLEAMFTATLEKQAINPEGEQAKDKPSSSEQQKDLTWHEGPPHWQCHTDPEAPPRYDYNF